MKKLLISILLVLALCTPVQATIPHTFAALTGTVPLSYLDDDFAYLYSYFGTITSAAWCRASATNIITCDVTPLVAGSNVQAYNAYLTGINQNLTTTSSPQFTAVTATTLTGALTGTASGNLTSAAIGTTIQGYNANTAIGPGTSTANHIAKFSGTDGKTLADGGALGTAATQNVGDFAPATSGSFPLKGDGAGGTAAATYTDVKALWTTGGSCSSGYLKSDGSCSTSTGMVYPAASGFAIYDTGSGTWTTSLDTVTSKMRTYLGTNQSIPSGIMTKVAFDTMTFDTLTEFDHTTNNNFTATKNGYYHTITSVEFASNVVNVSYCAEILKTHGVGTSWVVNCRGGIGGYAGGIILQVTDDFYLAAGDTLDVRASQNTGGAINIASGTIYTYFTVHRIFP